MRLALRELGFVLRASWQLAPVHTLFAFVLGPVSALTVSGSALAQRALVDTAPNAAPLSLLYVALFGGAVYAAWLALNRLQMNLRDLVVDLVVARTRFEKLRLIGDRRAFEDLSDPQYADALDLLRRRVDRLADFGWTVYAGVTMIVGLVISIAVLITIDVRLIVIAVGVALSILAALFLARRTVRDEHELALVRRQERQLHESCVSPDSVQEVSSYCAGRLIDERADLLWRQIADRQLRTAMRGQVGLAAGLAVLGAALVFGIVLVSEQIGAGGHTLGDLVLVISLTIGLRSQLQGAIQQLGAIGGSYSSAKALAFMRGRARASAPDPPAPVARVSSGISLTGAAFSYAGSSTETLHETTLQIPAGSIVAIVGRNGAGKSTLANVLLGILRPTSGFVQVDGAPLDEDAWRRSATGAFQDFMKPRFTLGEAVGLGDVAGLGDDGRLTASLTAADDGTLLRSLPEGLRTKLAAPVNLSHGQWQTVAIARSGMREEPVLLVLDEPSSALDAHAERELFASFVERGRDAARLRGAISILISHRYSSALLADLILVMEQGVVVEQGTHAELMELGGEYARMYELQRAAYLD